MDYEFGSSDILFPGEDSDIEATKLSISMSKKIPECLDWAKQDFLETFNDKTVYALERYIGLEQRIKINDNHFYGEENGCLGPLHTTETSREEKILMFKGYSSYCNYEYDKQNMINGAMDMIQADIQKRSNRHPFGQGQLSVSWKDEMYKEYNGVGSLDNFSDMKPKLNQIPNCYHDLTNGDIGVTPERGININTMTTTSTTTVAAAGIGRAGESNVRSPDETDTNYSVTDYPTQPSINRRESSNISRLARYFKKRIEKTMTTLFS